MNKTSAEDEEELLNDEDIVLIMRRKFGTKDFKVKSWKLDRMKAAAGFLGQYFNLRVTCAVGNDEKNFTFFAKTKPPRSSCQYEFATTFNFIGKEIGFYEEIATKMGKGEGPEWMPDYYFSKSETIIVLEDVTVRGFAMPEKISAFEYDECVLMISTIARFHARSIVLDEKLRRNSGENIEQVYGEFLKEGLYPSEDRTRRNAISASVQGAYGLINLMDCLDDRSKLRVKNLIAEWAWRIPRLVRSSRKFRNVICHRDLWSNNMMIKRDSGGPKALLLVDFQFVRYSPPAIDFMIALYLTTRRKTREERFEELAKIYHDAVRKELATENLEVDDCDLSFESFRDSCEYYRYLAIIYTTMCQQVMLIDEKTSSKYLSKSPELLDRVLWGTGRQDLVCPIFATDPRYRERLTENLMEINDRREEFEDWRYCE